MGSPSQPLVSIVTPIYNEAKHLAECIESVLAQTYQNWEYTIVDNCSTDGSVEIARRYSEQDRRIRVYQNQKFLTAISNHNLALRQISPESKYCKVVLGDDWIFPECLERMVAVAEEHSSAGIVSAYALEDRQVVWTGLPYSSTLVCGREVCRRHLLEGLYVFGSATTVLYRADLVRRHDPFYNEGNLHADTEACFSLLKSSDLGFVHQVLTFTRYRPESRSSASWNLQSWLAGDLQLLVAYGRDYLTCDELRGCLDRHLAAYYRFLGKGLLLRRNQSFWDFHKKNLSEAGLGFSRARLARGALATVSDALLSPKRTIVGLLKSKEQSMADRERTYWASRLTVHGRETR